MAFVEKTWKDRIVQYANRRLLTKSGGEVEQVTVTRDEGTVSVAGDKFDAASMNDLENRVKTAIDTIENTIATSEVLTPTLSHVSTSTGAAEKIWVWKSGKVVTMTVDIILAQTSQALAVFTLPVDFRPPVNITVNAQAFGSASNVARYCTINAGGNVVFYSTDTARLLFNVAFGT